MSVSECRRPVAHGCRATGLIAVALLAAACEVDQTARNSFWDTPAARGGVASTAEAAWTSPYRTPAASPAIAAQPAGMRTVTVAPGDTLFGIARRNRLAVASLANANGIAPTTPLRVGDSLRIPGAGSGVSADLTMTGSIRASEPAAAADTVTVAPGDTLYSLARRHGVSLLALAEANRIAPPYAVGVGRQLRLPGRRAATAAPSAMPAAAPAAAVATPAATPAAAVAMATAAPAAAVATPVAAAPAAPRSRDYVYQFHKVTPGETLDRIAVRYRIEPAALAAFNQLPAGAPLAPGQTLRVPM